MLLNRVRLALAQRWRLAARKRFLQQAFRNSDELLGSLKAGTPCGVALCRDGITLHHPPDRTGLAQMILEVWYEQVYTGSFYQPSPQDTIIDAGANIGLFSILLALREPRCTVLAFEPFAENFRLLKANLEAARAGNVQAVQAALSGRPGLCEMIDGGRRSQDHRRVAASSSDAETAIPQVSLKEVLSLASPGPIALFKCDIEGSEYDLFDTAEADDLVRIQRFAIEYHDNLRPGSLQLLHDRLQATHKVISHQRKPNVSGYGMLYATLRGSRGAMK